MNKLELKKQIKIKYDTLSNFVIKHDLNYAFFNNWINGRENKYKKAQDICEIEFGDMNE